MKNYSHNTPTMVPQNPHPISRSSE